ncbi:MAG TPA: hypothetical protein VD815_08275 [Candidatus Saccharimonadales bacterium]|nr:hypothetical protein [Candidatus Saccharimonadales bacterium]
MANLQKIVVPGVVTCLIGGTIMLLLAFSYYPEKHVNANLNGTCYELVDAAYIKYKNLEVDRWKALKMLQIQAIGSPDISVPITFSGTNKEVNDFMADKNINETERQLLGDNNPNIDKVIIRGTILNENLQKIVNDFSKNDTMLYGLGIQPNPYITSIESRQIGENVNQLMETRLIEIIKEKDGVKSAECRSKIVYNGNLETP